MASLKQINGTLEFVDDRGQVCSIDGELIADAQLNPEYPPKALYEEFFASPEGEDFLERFDTDTVNSKTGLTNAAVVERVFMKLYANDLRLTMSRFQDAVQTAIAAGELTPIPEEPVAAPPRNESGQFANALDIDVKRLIETNPGEISRRVRVDREFAAAVDRVMYPKTTIAAPVVSDPELIEFARLYTNHPIPRPVNGEYFYQDGFGGRRYSVSEFKGLVERCIAAKLL